MNNDDRDKAIADLTARLNALQPSTDLENRVKALEDELAALRSALEPTGLPPKEGSDVRNEKA